MVLQFCVYSKRCAKIQLRFLQFDFFSGSKSFVTISQHANLLVVVAEKSEELKREYEMDEEDGDDFFDAHLTIVLDPKSTGITIVDQSKTIGCNDVPFATINFSNVYVDKSQILSEGQDDRKTSEKLLSSSRLQSATVNMIQTKNILKQLINFSLSAECNSQKLR